MHRPERWSLLATSVMAVVALIGCSSTDRRASVADRGSEVMPFDLDLTTHRFTPTRTGLVEDVIVDDPDDAEQIELIRAHLTEETERFTAGDFGDPAQIHGREMPGLAELEAGAADIQIRYSELPDGARITFSTTDAELVTALERWGRAQMDDHGEHAR